MLPIYEAGEDGGRLFLTMGWVEGTDLRALLARHRRLEPARAVRIVEQVADALDAAHERGLVHRDVKPANILIQERGGREHAFLTDFGVTKRVSADAVTLTEKGSWVGTLDYISPEQIQGHAIDARADEYSALGRATSAATSGRELPKGERSVARGGAAPKRRRPPARITAAVAAALLLGVMGAAAALLIANRGGGKKDRTHQTGSKADRDHISAAIQLEGTSRSPSVCREVISTAALKRLGGEKGCSQAVAGNDARSESVTGVRVAGTTAVAQATVHGGINDGCVYALSMVKQDGKWKVDSQSAISQQPVCLK